MEDITRMQPHSLEAEQSILGAILLDKDIVNIASKKLSPDNFYKEYNKIIFESMLSLLEDNKPIDLITVTEKLKAIGHLEDVGGISYITGLTTIVPTTSNIKHYIDIVKEKHSIRQGISIASSVIDKLYGSNIKSIDSDIENLKRIMVNNKKIENIYVDASSIKRDKKLIQFIPTGFAPIDNLLGGGLRCSSLTVLTGEPGSGKSTIINQILAGSIADNYKSFLYSGELPASDLMFWFKRTVANDYHLVSKISKAGNEFIDIEDYCWNLISEWIKDKFFIYGDDSVANKNNILSVIENLAINKNVKLFVLDNLMTFDIGDHSKQYQEQKQLCLSLKQLAKKYGLSIILVAHPKKPTEKDKPSMYDVSGASEIVGSADTVLRIVRAKDNEENSKILLLKNRWGGVINRAVSIDFDVKRKRYYTNKSEFDRNYGYDKNKQFVQVNMESPF